MTAAVLLIGHGSRDRSGNAQFLALANTLAGRLPGQTLQPCFLDHASPDVPEEIARLANCGVRDIAAVPLFLFAAAHAKLDVPRLLDAARQRHPDIRFGYGRPLGVHSALVSACKRLLLEANSATGLPGPQIGVADTAVLLVGRGSSDPEPGEALREIARLLKAETGFGAVECAYCDVTAPSVPQGLAACVAWGARRVILLPCFLFQGVLMRRLRQTLAEWQELCPLVDFRFAGSRGLGESPEIQDLILERIGEATAVPASRR